MAQIIRHRRLHAFFQSKVLNSFMIVTIVSLLAMQCCTSMLMPLVCAGTAMLFFIGYALWIWIKKPKSIVINNWISNLNSSFVFYYLIISASKSTNEWWYIFPAVSAICMLFIAMVTSHDEVFKI